MKTKLLAIALLAVTGAAVAFYPSINNTQPVQPPVPPLANGNNKPKVDVVFVLDTTGSMGGLIQAAKEKIWSIAGTMASAQPAPEIRVGLVAYRDRGDDYVTRVYDLSTDLDSLYAQLMDFEAAGGGDGPESVNQALHDAVFRASWSEDPNAYKVVFLVGDAPPHMDYQDEMPYAQVLATARQRNIIVNAIQCGALPETQSSWQQIAQLGSGRFFQVGQAGSAVAIATPYDKKIADLSAELDDTRLYYGSPATREAKQAKLAATDKLNTESSIASRARRGVFNASSAGEANFAGDSELVDDVASGRVDLAKVAPAALPEPLQALPIEEREKVVAGKVKKRDELQQQIRQLADERQNYLKKEVDKLGGAKDSLDEKIFDAVREQGAGVGLKYDGASKMY